MPSEARCVQRGDDGNFCCLRDVCPQSSTPAGLSELLPPSEKLQWADSSQGAGQISTCLTSQHLGLEARSGQEFKNSLRYMASLRGQGYMGPKS